MRCKCCDRRMTEAESNSKDKLTGEYLDLCRKCREWSLGNINNYDIKTEEELDFIGQWIKERS